MYPSGSSRAAGRRRRSVGLQQSASDWRCSCMAVVETHNPVMCDVACLMAISRPIYLCVHICKSSQSGNSNRPSSSSSRTHTRVDVTEPPRWSERYGITPPAYTAITTVQSVRHAHDGPRRRRTESCSRDRHDPSDPAGHPGTRPPLPSLQSSPHSCCLLELLAEARTTAPGARGRNPR